MSRRFVARRHSPSEEAAMANSHPPVESLGVPGEPVELSDEPVPVMQQLLDNPFILLFLGITLPAVLYTIWGVMEIVNIPVAR
jgi:hypothetical protein